MATYVYAIATGALVSWLPDDAEANDPTHPDAHKNGVAPLDHLTALGFAYVNGFPALDSTHDWDEATKTVVIVMAPPSPLLVKKAAWVMRFTPAEFKGVLASVDEDVAHWVFAFQAEGEFIDLSGAQYQTGVPALAQKGLIDQARVATLLEP